MGENLELDKQALIQLSNAEEPNPFMGPYFTSTLDKSIAYPEKDTIRMQLLIQSAKIYQALTKCKILY